MSVAGPCGHKAAYCGLLIILMLNIKQLLNNSLWVTHIRGLISGFSSALNRGEQFIKIMHPPKPRPTGVSHSLMVNSEMGAALASAFQSKVNTTQSGSFNKHHI